MKSDFWLAHKAAATEISADAACEPHGAALMPPSDTLLRIQPAAGMSFFSFSPQLAEA